MKILSFFRINFSVLGIVGITFILPIICALYYGEYNMIPSFAIPMAVSIFLSVLISILGKKKKITLSTRDAFIIVAWAWIFCAILGAVPFYISGCFPSITDAVFESVSGFSTTGCTTLSEIETLPVCINLWRCETHWLGGMGIVALTVALFPLLGVGGFQLIKAETTGPEKGKITPRITTTAKALWTIYILLTIVQTILLKIAGMSFFDALSHTFSTLGTGGFSTRNESVGGYNSTAIDVICTVFMFLAGINFSMYFYLITGKFNDIRQNSELKVYLALCFIFSVTIGILLRPVYGGFFHALRYSSFQTAAILTTTGFANADYTTWPHAAQMLIFFLFFIGGCAGSTGGGVKVVRWVILYKQAKNEMLKMLHPHGVFSIRLNGGAGRKDIVFSVTSFLFIYVLLVLVTSLVGTCYGLDVLTAFTGAISMVGNVGPAFGNLGPSCNYGFLACGLKWWYMFAMVAGRLELYTMIIFLLPDFWRK